MNQTLLGRIKGGEISVQSVLSVGWDIIGIDPADQNKLEILEPAGAIADVLHLDIGYSFKIKLGPQQRHTIQQLPMRLLLKPDQTWEGLQKDYKVDNQGILWDPGDDVVRKLPVKGPANVIRDEAFMNRLIAIVDVAQAKDEAGRLTALIRLGLSGSLTQAELGRLNEIVIQKVGGVGGKMPALVFNKKSQ